MLRIGIDIGGTFTDFVVFDPSDGRLQTFKFLTDTQNPASTVLSGLKKILSGSSSEIVHGSTIATNALLERRGSRTALITTSGFKDILQIGRQNRQNLYDLNQPQSPPIIPNYNRFEIKERIDSNGKVSIPIDLSGFENILEQLKQNQIESIAICFLFSFLFPKHEQVIAEILEKAGYFVSVSSEILPEYREYERMSTTVVNAYVSPLLEKYLSLLHGSIAKSSIQVMQSNGGMISILEASRNGARCILSGPAGGVVGAHQIMKEVLSVSENLFIDPSIKVITFDMGGTSTDISLIDGKPILSTNSSVGGLPIHLPMLDIHTIGAGGGSIAYTDAGGALRVGPQSAGAKPGPACYGDSDLPTVTDANLLLGRLIPDYFLGGEMQIYPERSFSAFTKLGKQLGLTPKHAAFGVIDVVNVQMERALRVKTVERGHDPRDFSLFSFGGAGGLHALDLARNLGIPKVIIPRYASTLSAFGMLVSDVTKDYVQTVMQAIKIDSAVLDEQFLRLEDRGKIEIQNQGISITKIETLRTLDLRYAGQSYELNVPYSATYLESFQEAHTAIYGYAFPNKNIEIVNIRVRVSGKIPPIRLPRIMPRKVNKKQLSHELIQVEYKDGKKSIPLMMFDNLQPGMDLDGPMLIISPDTSILIGPGDTVYVDDFLNLIITINQNKLMS